MPVGVFDYEGAWPAPTVTFDGREATMLVTSGHSSEGDGYNTNGERITAQLNINGCCGTGPIWPDPNDHQFVCDGTCENDGQTAEFVFGRLIVGNLYAFYYQGYYGGSPPYSKPYIIRIPGPIDTPPAPGIRTNVITFGCGGCYPYIDLLEPPYGAIADAGACDAKLFIRRITGDPSDSVSDPESSGGEYEWGVVDLSNTTGAIEVAPEPNQTLAFPFSSYSTADSQGNIIGDTHSIIAGAFYEAKWVFYGGENGSTFYDSDYDYFEPSPPTTKTLAEGPVSTFQAPYLSGAVEGEASEYDADANVYFGDFTFTPGEGEGPFTCTWEAVSAGVEKV